MAPKLTIIGGGSSSFVPPLLRRLIQSRILEGATVTLMDIDRGRLAVMDALAQKLIAAESSRLVMRSTENQRQALSDADFVIAAISVGGMDAWEQDLEIPGRHGLVMHVADSVGPGGIMRALRNAPVLAGVTRDVAEVAPEAYVFNYTNPAPTEALAMATTPSVEVFALCSCTAALKSGPRIAAELGVDADMVLMPPVVAGINHCAAIVELRLADGRDGLAVAREKVRNPIARWALHTYGVLPYCWTHWTEHFPQMQRLEEPYAGRAQGVAMRYGITTHDMDNERARVSELEQLASQWTAPDAPPMGLADLPLGHEEEGIEVIDIIEAIVDNRDAMHVVNVVNHGTIPNLPPEAFVEVNTRVSAYGIRPTYVGPISEPWAAHLRYFVALEQQIVKAALTGDRHAALQAFVMEPTIAARLDLEQTEALLDEMLAANADHLPLFQRD